MLVKDLIKTLNKFDPEQEVILAEGEYEYGTVLKVLADSDQLAGDDTTDVEIQIGWS